MKLSSQIRISGLLVIVLFVAAVLVNLTCQRQFANVAAKDVLVSDLEYFLFQRSQLMQDYLVYNSPATSMQLSALHRKISETLRQMAALFKGPEEKMLLQDIRSSHDRIGIPFPRLLTLDSGREGQPNTLRSQRERLVVQIGMSRDRTFRTSQNLLKMTIRNLASQGDKIHLYSNTVLLVILTFLLCLLFLVVRNIVRPLARLHRSTEIIGSGDLDHRVGITTRNEMGQLSSAFDRMTSKLKEVTASRDDLNREIAERQRMEEAVKQSENLLKQVLETLPIGVWITDKNGKIIYGNPAGKNVWQGIEYVEPSEFHKYKAWWYKNGKLISPAEWAVTRAISKKEVSFEEEIEIECFDGTHKIINNWALPILNKDGEVEGAIAVNHDITERKQEREERERLIAQLQTALAEIKTLQGILPICSFCKKIRNDDGYYEQIESYIHKHSDVDFSHTICPPCLKKHYPEAYGVVMKKEGKET